MRDDPYVIPDEQQHGEENTRAREEDGEPVEPGLGGSEHEPHTSASTRKRPPQTLGAVALGDWRVRRIRQRGKLTGLCNFFATGSRHDHRFMHRAVFPVVVDGKASSTTGLAAHAARRKLPRRTIATGERLGAYGMFSHVGFSNCSRRNIPGPEKKPR